MLMKHVKMGLAVLFLTAVTGVRTEESTGCPFRGKTYAVGERWATGPPDKCAKYLCEDDDQIAALTCPWFVAAPGCSVVPGDENAVYPGCCPLRKCHDPVQDPVNKAPVKNPAQGSERDADNHLISVDDERDTAATTTQSLSTTETTVTMTVTTADAPAVTETVTTPTTTDTDSPTPVTVTMTPSP